MVGDFFFSDVKVIMILKRALIIIQERKSSDTVFFADISEQCLCSLLALLQTIKELLNCQREKAYDEEAMEKKGKC